MEVPSRKPGDQLLPAGECSDIRRRLRRLAPHHDLTAVAVNAFDHRTRMLPFFWSSMHMVPAGIRSLGSSLVDSGFAKTRLVLSQWNRKFQPSRMSLDGRMPDVLMVSSMQIHSAACEALIRDACTLPLDKRPLIIAGGPKVIYEPWSVFGDTWGADLAVTGEDYVLLHFLEALLAERGRGEPLRSAYDRARKTGLLNAVPGLVYPSAPGGPRELIDTGTQRMVKDLDELADPVLGYQIIEPPSSKPTLAAAPLPPGKIRRLAPIGSLVFTSGCKFSCPYCPIPAYNQRQHRVKSPGRIVEEFARLNQEYGLKYFFGTDDNFFNDKARTTAIVETVATSTNSSGVPLRSLVRWGTEVTVHDTLQMKDHLKSVRRAGCMMLWLGVEDITGTFVKKGQSVDKTLEAFSLLRKNHIMPVPMLMNHPGQPLWTRGSHYGLLNQVRLLRKAGAIDVQVLSMTPATGSRIYEETFTSGNVIGNAGGREVLPHMLDANFVVSAGGGSAWKMQLRVAAVLAYLYNPVQFMRALVWSLSSRYLFDAALQFVGMWGLMHTLPAMFGWAVRLMGKQTPRLTPPGSSIPVRRLADDAAPPTT